MSINQNLNNITQSGTSQEINANIDGASFTEGQGYCLIIGFTLILITLILVIGKIIQTAILKINVLNKKYIEYIIERVKDDLENKS